MEELHCFCTGLRPDILMIKGLLCVLQCAEQKNNYGSRGPFERSEKLFKSIGKERLLSIASEHLFCVTTLSKKMP